MPTSNEPTFTSVLGPIISDLICEKRGIGYHYNKEVRDFARFDRFCVAVGHHDLALPRELVDAWTVKQAHETEINRQLSAVIENCTLAVTRIAYGRPSLLHTLPHVAVSDFCG